MGRGRLGFLLIGGGAYTYTYNPSTPTPPTHPSTHTTPTTSIKQICDLFCRVQPEARAVDLHGLSLTATTQGFLGRNEPLARYMALALQQVGEWVIVV